MKNREQHVYSTHLPNKGVGMLVGMLFDLLIEFEKLKAGAKTDE